MHIRSFFMSYDSGDANLGDSETINHVVKLLQRDVLWLLWGYFLYRAPFPIRKDALMNNAIFERLTH